MFITYAPIGLYTRTLRSSTPHPITASQKERNATRRTTLGPGHSTKNVAKKEKRRDDDFGNILPKVLPVSYHSRRRCSIASVFNFAPEAPKGY